MERKISLNDVKKAVYDAYENYKSEKAGAVDPCIKNDPKAFGISVVLADGTVINKGDTATAAVLGDVARLPLDITWLMQDSPKEVAKKLYDANKKGKKVHCSVLGFSAKGVRSASAIAPQNDPDGKWDIIINNVINIMGSAPVLDDDYYKCLLDKANSEKAVDKLAEYDYVLFDDAETAVKVYCKLMAMKVTTQQLATFGAAIAADGRNVTNNAVAFDGTISAPALAMNLKGIHGDSKNWLVEVGLPARSGRGGLVVAVMPGFGAIAAFSPEVDEKGVSVKAKDAVAYIAKTLGLNVFASARVQVEPATVNA